MARPLRIEFPGAWYHVTCRGNEKRNIFQWERWCEVNLCILEKSSSAPGKINETEYSDFSSEMRKTTDLDLNHFRVRNFHANILIGMASDRYAARRGTGHLRRWKALFLLNAVSNYYYM